MKALKIKLVLAIASSAILFLSSNTTASYEKSSSSSSCQDCVCDAKNLYSEDIRVALIQEKYCEGRWRYLAVSITANGNSLQFPQNDNQAVTACSFTRELNGRYRLVFFHKDVKVADGKGGEISFLEKFEQAQNVGDSIDTEITLSDIYKAQSKLAACIAEKNRSLKLGIAGYALKVNYSNNQSTACRIDHCKGCWKLAPAFTGYQILQIDKISIKNGIPGEAALFTIHGNVQGALADTSSNCGKIKLEELKRKDGNSYYKGVTIYKILYSTSLDDKNCKWQSVAYLHDYEKSFGGNHSYYDQGKDFIQYFSRSSGDIQTCVAKLLEKINGKSIYQGLEIK